MLVQLNERDKKRASIEIPARNPISLLKVQAKCQRNCMLIMNLLDAFLSFTGSIMGKELVKRDANE